MENSSEIIISLGDFNGHRGKCAEGVEGVHERIGIEKRNTEGRRLLEFCDEKKLCVANTWFYKRKGKSLKVRMNVKLILCLRGKNTKNMLEYKSDSMGTPAQTGGCRSE